MKNIVVMNSEEHCLVEEGFTFPSLKGQSIYISKGNIWKEEIVMAPIERGLKTL